MNIEESAKQYQEMVDKINEKYNNGVKKIQYIMDTIQNAYTIYVHNTKVWIDNKIKELRFRAEKIKQQIEKWLNDQLKKIADWLDGVKKQVETLIKAILAELMSMII